MELNVDFYQQKFRSEIKHFGGLNFEAFFKKKKKKADIYKYYNYWGKEILATLFCHFLYLLFDKYTSLSHIF